MFDDRGVVWACITLAVVTAVLLFLFNKPLAPEPALFMKPVPVEGITARRMDDTSFARRFALVPIDVTPLRPQSRDGCGDACPTRSGKDTLEAGSVRTATTGKSEARKARQHIVRRAALRLDICARHGMRKVSYGKRWRCRR